MNYDISRFSIAFNKSEQSIRCLGDDQCKHLSLAINALKITGIKAYWQPVYRPPLQLNTKWTMNALLAPYTTVVLNWGMPHQVAVEDGMQEYMHAMLTKFAKHTNRRAYFLELNHFSRLRVNMVNCRSMA
jgi:hypothetical protein